MVSGLTLQIHFWDALRGLIFGACESFWSSEVVIFVGGVDGGRDVESEVLGPDMAYDWRREMSHVSKL